GRGPASDRDREETVPIGFPPSWKMTWWKLRYSFEPSTGRDYGKEDTSMRGAESLSRQPSRRPANNRGWRAKKEGSRVAESRLASETTGEETCLPCPTSTSPAVRHRTRNTAGAWRHTKPGRDGSCCATS